ncbi:MAG TPA: ribonuclease HII [Gemmatimonadaceae bacterium]|nr:ribonuclease HII [Gemmatimonadaceae bacterium]
MGRRWSPIERELRQEYGPLLAGVDEVGRGPLAGPVVACAAVMPADKAAIRGVNDSKQLTRADRERFAGRIRDQAVGLALGAASVREIERVNIYHATVLAMRRALSRLAATGVTPNYVVVDGKPVRSLGIPHRAVVHGDARCYSVACASIIAKVTRDALLRRLAARHPCYGWDRNVGYGTRFHWSSLKEHGLSLHHRRAFCEDDQLELELVLDDAFVE